VSARRRDGAVRARRASRAGLLGALTCVALLVAPTPVPQAQARPDARAGESAATSRQPAPSTTTPVPAAQPLEDASALQVVIRSVTPSVPGPGTELRVRGVIRNRGTTAVEQPLVRLRFSPTALGSREDIDDIVSGESPSRLGFALLATTTELTESLAPGQDAPFDLRYDLDNLGIPAELGVYVIGVEVGLDVDGLFTTEELVRTFLPWSPPESPGSTASPQSTERPTRLSWLWPVVDTPRRGLDGVFRDDALAHSLTAGRLSRVLDLGAQAPPGAITWAVDPMLLEDLQVMSGGYAVRADAAPSPSATSTPGAATTAGPTSGPAPTGAAATPGVPSNPASPSTAPTNDPAEPADTTTVPGTGAAAAESYLQRLRTSTSTADLLSLPYADQDVVAVSDAGMGHDVRRAREAGARVTDELLGRAATTDVAWPPGGAMDARTGGLLADAGVEAVVLSEQAVPPAEEVSFTPTGRAQISVDGARLDAMLYDERLSRLVATRPRAATRALIQQQFLAETALLTAELPDQRTVLVAPPRQFSPDPRTAAALLDLTATVPWLTPVTLAEVRTTAVSDVARAELDYPDRAAAAELPAAGMRAISSLHRDLRGFIGVLTEPDATEARYQSALLRLQSSAWRRATPPWRHAITQVRAALDGDRSKVSLLGSRVTLGARSGVFPITVVNDLDQPVRVRVAARSTSPRLRVEDSEPVTVDAQQKAQLRLPISAVANGLVEVEGWLETADGTVYGPPVSIQVRVAQYGTLGVWVTGGAAVVLFAGAALNIARKVRRRNRERAGGEAPDDSGEEA
jgi:hypothetical protein